MLFSILIAIIVGVMFGCVSGLIPGIHVNLISVILLESSMFLFNFFSPLSVCIIIISTAITHSFLDSIPSIFLGAPDSDQILSVLPGHRLLNNGQGHYAVVLTLIGSYGALLISIIFVPIIIKILPIMYVLIKDFIAQILVVIILFIILKDGNRFYNFIFFLLSGFLGIICFNLPNQTNILFPLLSGLFGVSLLIPSLFEKNSSFPKQKNSFRFNVKIIKLELQLFLSFFVGFIASFLPGFGSSQAAILATIPQKNPTPEEFLILTGGINTVNFTLSLVTFYLLSKARNGAVVSISKLFNEWSLEVFILFFIIALIVGSLALFIGINLSKTFALYFSKLPYKKVLLSVILFIFLMSFILSGIQGIIILLTSISIGIVSSRFNTAKSFLLGCLILPVIINLW